MNRLDFLSKGLCFYIKQMLKNNKVWGILMLSNRRNCAQFRETQQALHSFRRPGGKVGPTSVNYYLVIKAKHSNRK